MSISFEQFNKEVKVIDKQLVSLPESWISDGKKYQMKFGDIFRTVNNEGRFVYYIYQDIGSAINVTGEIELYFERENVVELDGFSYGFLFDHESDYWCFGNEEGYFESKLDEDNLVVEQGIESYKSLGENLVDVQLIHINDVSKIGDFTEEWEGKSIVADFGNSSYGKLGEKTTVEGVFVGDIYELYDADTEERDNYTVIKYGKGDFKFSSYQCEEQDLEWVFKQAQIEIDEALEDGLTEDEIAIYLPKKYKSYKNFIESDALWAGNFSLS